ncbi:hypothetical protein AC51_4956 [Escherichia coli 5-172-05_S3_C3]|nr:hypothetical protein AC51_4956 [Escherichia coli 5-172-05_S3_C3]
MGKETCSKTGGYPPVQTTPNTLIERIHQTYCTEILNFYQPRRPKEVRIYQKMYTNVT